MKLILGVSGGIAAYKSCELISYLRKKSAIEEWDFECRVIMTQNATRFITPLTFEALTRHEVMTSTFSDALHHIDWAKWASHFCIAPATANLLAKIANGFCDDALTTTLCAAPVSTPKVLAPAMNTVMWENPATQRNLELISRDGFQIAAPISKRLACGDYGVGGLAEISHIASLILKQST